jgi:hypothetical protein
VPRTLLLLLLLLASPARAGPVHCTTYKAQTRHRWHTVCADGTRAVSTWNRTLECWETTITESPKTACTARKNARTRQVEGRCR